jgi:hypothetical protein
VRLPMSSYQILPTYCHKYLAHANFQFWRAFLLNSSLASIAGLLNVRHYSNDTNTPMTDHVESLLRFQTFLSRFLNS